MAGSRMKKVDRNRHKKVYPIYRGLPNNVYQSDKEVIIETQDVIFAAEDSKTVVLAEFYSTVPIITVALQHSNGDVNVFISSVSVVAGVATVIVGASSTFSGTLHLQSIMIGT